MASASKPTRAILRLNRTVLICKKSIIAKIDHTDIAIQISVILKCMPKGAARAGGWTAEEGSARGHGKDHGAGRALRELEAR